MTLHTEMVFLKPVEWTMVLYSLKVRPIIIRTIENGNYASRLPSLLLERSLESFFPPPHPLLKISFFLVEHIAYLVFTGISTIQ